MPVVAGIIDIGTGNIHSLSRVLTTLGAGVIVCEDAFSVRKADKLILPGVGHYGRACRHINAKGMRGILEEEVLVQGKPVLGICLGMQLMVPKSEEDEQAEGLGLINGIARRLTITDEFLYKVPHLGWNNLSIRQESPLLTGLTEKDEFYFMHSFCVDGVAENAVAARTEYDSCFTSVISQKNIFGVQFHPEKSHASGRKLIQNFLFL